MSSQLANTKKRNERIPYLSIYEQYYNSTIINIQEIISLDYIIASLKHNNMESQSENEQLEFIIIQYWKTEVRLRRHWREHTFCTEDP